jgi:hypothetical protein
VGRNISWVETSEGFQHQRSCQWPGGIGCLQDSDPRGHSLLHPSETQLEWGIRVSLILIYYQSQSTYLNFLQCLNSGVYALMNTYAYVYLLMFLRFSFPPPALTGRTTPPQPRRRLSTRLHLHPPTGHPLAQRHHSPQEGDGSGRLQLAVHPFPASVVPDAGICRRFQLHLEATHLPLDTSHDRRHETESFGKGGF